VGRTESFTGARTKKEKDKRKRLRFKVKKSDQLRNLPQWVLKVYRKELAGQRTLATDKY
jgi:hypothetical protein